MNLPFYCRIIYRNGKTKFVLGREDSEMGKGMYDAMGLIGSILMVLGAALLTSLPATVVGDLLNHGFIVNPTFTAVMLAISVLIFTVGALSRHKWKKYLEVENHKPERI
jgi:hypothetical protein